MKLERIVVGIDFSPSSIAAAKWVARYFEGVDVVLAWERDRCTGRFGSASATLRP